MRIVLNVVATGEAADGVRALVDPWDHLKAGESKLFMVRKPDGKLQVVALQLDELSTIPPLSVIEISVES